MHWRTRRCIALALVLFQTVLWFACSRAFSAIAPSAPAVLSREHACELVAALLLVPLSVVGVCLDSPHAQAAARACFAHDLMLVTVSIDGLCTWQAAAHNSSVAWSADYLAAWFGPRSDWLQFVS